jgi:hypothetical protein
VDEADPNGPWAYYQATVDSNGNTGWTVYILSWDVIYLPENCDNLFMDMSNLVSVDTTACDTRYVTKAVNMFNGCRNLKTVYVSAEGGWDALSDRMADTVMFASCNRLMGGAGTTYSSQYGDYARIDGGSDAPGYFTAK